MHVDVASRRVTARLAIALAVLAIGSCRTPAASAQAAPRPVLFIEGFRTTGSLSRHAASALRDRTTRLSAERGWPVHVLTTGEIDGFRAVGSPDHFGGAWPWTDVREAAKVYRAYAVVDVIAIREPAGVRLELSRLYPVPSGTATRLPDVRAASVDAAVTQVAARLAADTIITRGR